MNNYIKKRIKSILLLILVLPVNLVLAAETSETRLGVGLFSFDYAEYDKDNLFLDGEKGLIPGILINHKQAYPGSKRYLEIDGGMYYSLVNYDGETWDGVPAKTRSDAFIIDGTFKSGIYLDQNEAHALYAGLGLHYWLRNIRSGVDSNGDPVSGILEHYTWLYALLGYRGELSRGSQFDWGIDIRITHMLAGQMDIDFLGFKNYDNTSVQLGNREGYKIGIPVRVKEYRNSYTVMPYIEYFRIGRSNDVRVTANGLPTSIFIHEPRSETMNFGIELHWMWD